MRRTLGWTGLVLAAWLLAAAAPAKANEACFDWTCDPSTLTCDFDAGCTTWTSGQLWRYSWDFGDGSGTVLTGNDEIQHDYSSGCWKLVKLTVLPFSADAFSVECEVRLQDCVGPALGTSGRCEPTE